MLFLRVWHFRLWPGYVSRADEIFKSINTILLLPQKARFKRRAFCL